MKKNLVLGVVLVLVLALSSCSKNIQENQAAEGDSVRFDLIGEFERADREKFNSPAEENGLGGTRIFMDGTIRDINSEQSSISGTLETEQGDWTVIVGSEPDNVLDECKVLQDKELRVFGYFMGYSEKYKNPVIYAIKYTDMATGESYGMLDFTGALKEMDEEAVKSCSQQNKKVEEDIQATAAEPTQMIPVTFGSLRVNVPADWRYEERDGIAYYYAKNNEFLMLSASQLDTDEEMNELLFESYIDGLKNSGGFSNFNIIEKDSKDTGKMKFYRLKFSADVSEYNTIAEIYVTAYGNELYSFMMSDVSNTYKYTDIMEDIISSVEVDQSNVPTDNTPETPQPTAEPQKYNPPKISLSEFNQLQDGISYEEAVEIIGSSGSLMSESSLGGISTKMYTWEGEGDIGANANAMFQNGKLISKAQYGLK